MSRRVSSFSVAVFGGLGAEGMRVGFMGGEGGAGRLRELPLVDEEAAVEAASWAEGTKEGDETERGAEIPVGAVDLDMIGLAGDVARFLVEAKGLLKGEKL